AVSALLCATSVALWVYSYLGADEVGYISRDGRVSGLNLERGTLYAVHTGQRLNELPPGWHLKRRPIRLDPWEYVTNHEFLGFQFRLLDPQYRFRFIGIPFWFLVVLTFIAP